MDCNHIIGYCVCDYEGTLVVQRDDPIGIHFDSFDPFHFCPACGQDVSFLSAAFKAREDQRHEAFWERYKTQHGEDEYQRARYHRGPKWEKQEEEKRRKSEEDQLKYQAKQQRLHDLMNPQPKPSHFFSIPKEP